MKWKAFVSNSLNALLSSIIQIKRTADGNASAVSDLGGNLAALAELTSKSLAGKQDKSNAVPFTIPADGWEQDHTADYPMYYDLKAPGVTVLDHAAVTISPTSVRTTADCGLCPACETLAGKIRFRAVSIPTVAMIGEYWLQKGKE